MIVNKSSLFITETVYTSLFSVGFIRIPQPKVKIILFKTIISRLCVDKRDIKAILDNLIFC